MAHQDQVRKCVAGTHAWDLWECLQWLLGEMPSDILPLRKDCTWTTKTLIAAGLLWAWSDEKTLIDRFGAVRKIITFWFGRQHEPAGSYQAFIKLLRKWTDRLLEILRPLFRDKMATSLASVWTVGKWLVFACDGSRIDVPRTRRNEACYSPKSKLSREAQRHRRRRRAKRRRKQDARRRKANIPQIWLTVLWHVGSGLPWEWCAGPSDSSEREHLRVMLSTLPPRSLLTADAGFVGYHLWKTVLESGHHLLIRVGGNVRLLKKLGYCRERAGRVYLWPDQAAKDNLPPLVLRLIVVPGPRHPVYLATSILDASQLSEAEAARIYARRWGIELFYRNCKQTFERRKLRSRSPENAMIELHWSLLGMWAMGLHSHHHLVQRGIPPQRISFAGVLRAYRRPMREYRCPATPGERSTDLLNKAIIDDYQRANKASRDYPRKKQESAAGPPRILKATRAQVQRAKQLGTNNKKRLTA